MALTNTNARPVITEELKDGLSILFRERVSLPDTFDTPDTLAIYSEASGSRIGTYGRKAGFTMDLVTEWPSNTLIGMSVSVSPEMRLLVDKKSARLSQDLPQPGGVSVWGDYKAS